MSAAVIPPAQFALRRSCADVSAKASGAARSRRNARSARHARSRAVQLPYAERLRCSNLRRLEELADHLRRGVAALYVVHGDEPLLALEAGDAIRAAARAAGGDERDVLVVEPGFKWDAFLGANANAGLFGDRKLVDLRIPSGKPGVEGGKALEAYAANPNPDNVTLVTLPRLDRATQSSAWFTALADAGVTIAVYPLEREALPGWIAARLARQQQRASRETLAFLADDCEGNLLAARQEIEKLALLLPEGELDHEAVEARGRRRRPLRHLRSFRRRGSPATPRARCASCARSKPKAKRRRCCDLAAGRRRARARRGRHAWSATGTPVVGGRAQRARVGQAADRRWSARRNAWLPALDRAAVDGARAARRAGEGHRERQRVGRAPTTVALALAGAGARSGGPDVPRDDRAGRWRRVRRYARRPSRVAA